MCGGHLLLVLARNGSLDGTLNTFALPSAGLFCERAMWMFRSEARLVLDGCFTGSLARAGYNGGHRKWRRFARERLFAMSLSEVRCSLIFHLFVVYRYYV